MRSPSIVTFEDFRKLARKRGWTVDMLMDRFHGLIEDRHDKFPESTKDFFTRVLTCRHKGESRGSNLIPYKSVLAFYQAEPSYQQEGHGWERFCECGCGRKVAGRRRFASQSCRCKKWRLRKVTDPPKTAVSA